MQNPKNEPNIKNLIKLPFRISLFLKKRWDGFVDKFQETIYMLLRVFSPIIKIIRGVDDFFERTSQQKERIREIVKEGLDIDLLYRLQLLSSVVIATFGLLINSIPVIIGAMLIAPLLQPIQGFSYAIATGGLRTYIKSIKHIALSILVALAGASLLTFIVPFRELTPEILARTTPTILDLGIAFASGIIAFLVIGFKKLSGTIVGAAIAASLLPPLCATGIGLVLLNPDVVGGTFLLFIANLVAIIIAGVLFFYLYGFRTYSKVGEVRKKRQLLVTVITLLLISIPLYSSMSKITHNWQTTKTIQTSLETTLPIINPQIKLMNFDKKELTDKYDISVQLKVPESIKVTTQDKNTISQHLASQLHFPVEVGIEVISVTSVYIPKEKTPSLDEQIHTAIVEFLGKDYKGIVVLDFVYTETSGKRFVILEIHSENPIDTKLLKQNISSFLTKRFIHPAYQQKSTSSSRITVDSLSQYTFYVYIKGQVQEKIYSNTGNELQQELLKQLGILFPNNTTDLFQVSFVKDEVFVTGSGLAISKDIVIINTSFSTDNDPIRTKKILSKWKQLLSQKLQQKVHINANISYFEKREE